MKQIFYSTTLAAVLALGFSGCSSAPTGEAKKAEVKKEPPKPRFVIDVFRGDKHVQETFQ